MTTPFSKYEYHELKAFVGKSTEHGTIHSDLAKASETATVEAGVIGWVQLYDSSYLLYTFSGTDLQSGARVDFLFAWDTPYDELHRGFGEHESQAYDSIDEGAEFQVEYLLEDPKEHRVITPGYSWLVGQVRLAAKE